jgi:hypothetical protein
MDNAERMDSAVRRVFSVPKAEVLEREVESQRAQAKRNRTKKT